MTFFSNEGKKPTGKLAWFAGANSRYGFWGIFDRIFPSERFLRLYILQGGPGTGKSSFMNEVARLSQEQGILTEYYFCSSDPSSLDGVILSKNGKRIGILDGTMPHPRQLTHPGYTENLINLGEFWSEEGLHEKKDRIRALEMQKKNAYTAAYAALGILGKAEEEKMRLIKEAYFPDKARHAAERLLRAIPPLSASAQGEPPIRYRKALGMTGEATLPTIEGLAKEYWLVEDHYGGAECFFRTLIGVMDKGKIGYLRCPQPHDPACTDCLLLPGGIAIMTSLPEGKVPDKRIRLDRFLDSEKVAMLRPHLRSLEKTSRTEWNRARLLLGNAGKAHFSLEEIYKETMNFQKKEQFTKEMAQEILRLLNVDEK